MSSTSRRPSVIVLRALLLAALLLGSPVPLVWFGAQRAETAIASGTLVEAERWLAVLGAFSTYPLLPTPARARIEGVACQLATAQGRRSDAVDHFQKEIAILVGRELNSEATGKEFEFLRFRKGIEAFREGFRNWSESAPDEFPTFDSDFLPERRAAGEVPEKDRRSPALSDAAVRLTEALPPLVSILRERYSAAIHEDADGQVGAFLAEHAKVVELARELADSMEDRSLSLDEVGPAADAFRLLLMDFVAKARAGEEAAALKSFEQCGRLLRAFESKPSIVALLVSTALRSGWYAAVEGLEAADALPTATKEGIAERLTLFGFDPRFPVECARHEYADQRDLLAGSLLGGSWEASPPAGKRLFVRALELNLAQARLLAEALDPETPPDQSDAILESIRDYDGHADAFLAMRPLMVDVWYGSRELGEEDGKVYGEAVDECVAATLAGNAQLRLGRLGSTLHELREEQRRVFESLREGRQ